MDLVTETKPFQEGRFTSIADWLIIIDRFIFGESVFGELSTMIPSLKIVFSVRIERHEGGGRTTKTDFNVTSRPEAKKPWVPASVNILNCENQKSKKRTKQTFGAVKHVD